ncbi:zinc finger protein 585A-like [Heteronotia binoei]|uniref:zinc finger protein 585A-like n=1 Tax=Heteronotia binoei TaxID=13085 RepID=UPI00292CFE4F|nr:zinc finger protein 585A-like [Heteronotia binoei]
MALVEIAQVPEAFVEVTVHSNEGQCSLVGRRQRVLYKNVMQENNVASLGGFPVQAAELLTRLERGEEAWVPDLHSSDESADEGPVKPTLKQLPKKGMWWGRYRSPVTYPSSDSSNSDDELESEAEEEKPQRGGQRLMVFHQSLLVNSRGNFKQRDSYKNGPQLKKHQQSQLGLTGESTVKIKTSVGNHRSTCLDCGQSFKSKLSLSNHQRKHTRENPYRCSCCGEKFMAKKALAAHQMSHAEEKGYKHPSRMKITTMLQMIHPKEKLYKCTQCEKSFTLKDHLVQHEKIHSNKRQYKCSICGRAFIRKEHLNRHQKIHRRQENDTSPKTAKVVRVESSTVAPKKKSTIDTKRTVALNTRHQKFSVNRFKCQFCGRCMRAKALLVDHERSHREERRYKCSHCNKSFYQKHSFEKHKTIHLRRQPDGRPPKRIKRLSEKSSPSDSGNFHIAEVPSESPVDRKIITRSFHLAQRLKLRTKKKIFKCQYCGKCMSTSCSLGNHERIHRRERLYKCQDCGETFHQKYHLDRHLVTHTSKKPLKLSKNVRKLNVKSSLPVLGGINTRQKRYKSLIHECIVTRNSRFARQPAVHTEEKPYKCRFCEKIMRAKNSLLIHERAHRRAKRYTCLECGKTFSQKNYLGCHQRSHRRKKPYECSDSDKSLTTKNASLCCGSPRERKLQYLCLKCGKSFDDNYCLNRHQIIHTGTKPFRCVTCGKGFIQTWHLRRHERTHLKARNHKQLGEPEESQLFFSAASVISEKKDQKDPPVNINGQTLRTEERNTSPNLKMTAFKGSGRVVSHSPEQGEMPVEAETKSQAFLSRKKKRKLRQNHKEAEVCIGQLLQPRSRQAGKDNALLQNKQTKNDLSQQAQPTKCSKKISLQSLKNGKVHAGRPLGLQANSVRKSQRETQQAGKQCRSCFCQQEEPGAAPGRKSKNSRTCMKARAYISPQREMQANVSSNVSKRALKSCKARKAWLDQQSQPLFSGASKMEANESPAVGISACGEQQEVLGKKVGGNPVSQSCMTLIPEAVDISEHQTLPRLYKSNAESSCQQIQAADKFKSTALQNLGMASASWQFGVQLTSLKTMEKLSPQQKVIACDNQQKRTIKRELETSATEENVAVSRLLLKHRCTECKKSFRSRANLLIHKKYHRGHRPFQCTQCEKSFYVLSALNIHMRIHTGEKPYKCSECPFRCNVSSNLSRHRQTHARQRPQACQLCNKRFWCSQSLQTHLKTHLDKEPHKCSDCGRVFTHKNSLKLHRRFKHSLEVVE